MNLNEVFYNMPKQLNEEDVYLMIEDCMKRSDFLTDWEAQFIDSIDTQSYERILSDQQKHQLESIWDRVTDKR